MKDRQGGRDSELEIETERVQGRCGEREIEQK